MRKILITGTNGTVGTYLKEYLQKKGFNIFCWDRTQIPINNYDIMKNYIEKIKPDILFHLATITSLDENKRENSWNVNYEWTSELAWITRIFNIKFIYTSTAMVFSNQSQGPFNELSIPDEKYGYGFEKLESEKQVMKQNPSSIIVRLGWQIAPKGTNSMINYIDNEIKHNNQINASKNFYPACSFIEDTIEFLEKCIDLKPGIYMFDSNKKWNFYQIVNALNKHLEKKWPINEIYNYKHDQRMQDSKINKIYLNKRLKELN